MTTTENFDSRIQNFLQISLTRMSQILANFILGIIVVYLCKVNQSQLLSSNENCSPYVDSDGSCRDFSKEVRKEGIVFQNPINEKTKEEIEMFNKQNKTVQLNYIKFGNRSYKINFPFQTIDKDEDGEYNFTSNVNYNPDDEESKKYYEYIPIFDNNNCKNSLLEFLRNKLNDPESGFLVHYFSSIYKDIINVNYIILSRFLNICKNIPEILLVRFLGGPLLIVCVIVLLVVSFLYSLYLYFYNFYWFLMTKNLQCKVDADPSNPGKKYIRKSKTVDTWTKMTWTNSSLIKWIQAFILIILFINIFLTTFTFFPFIFALFPVVSVIFTSLGYTAITKVEKKINLMNFLFDFLKYYKVSIMVTYSIIIIINSFLYLGAISGVFAILTVILIRMNIIKIDLYKSVDPDKSLLTPVIHEKQIERVCKEKIKKKIDENHCDDSKLNENTEQTEQSTEQNTKQTEKITENIMKGGKNLVNMIKMIGGKLNKY